MIDSGMELSFLTKRSGACAGAGGGVGTKTKACLGAGAGGKRQSCNRHGHPAAKAWGPEEEAAQGPWEGNRATSYHSGLFSIVRISLLSFPNLFRSWRMGY